MRFSYIHLSDFHFCIEPKRNNALTLMKRRPRVMIDTFVNQIEDTSFSSFAKPASYNPDILSGVAQFCYERAKITDGIIVTGDLATTGMMSDIGVAYAFIADPAANGFMSGLFSPTLNHPGVRIHVLPGNHDKYTN